MPGEPVDLSILRALAPEHAQARFCQRRGDSDSVCSKEHVGEVEVVVAPDALGQLCAGHFPGRPIVPGSHLIALMVDVAGLLSIGGGGEITVRRAVFRRPVGAEGCLWIRARQGRTPGRVDAEVRSGGDVAGSEAGERSVVASARLEVGR